MKENTGLKPGVKVLVSEAWAGVIQTQGYDLRGEKGLSYLILANDGSKAELEHQNNLELVEQWEPVDMDSGEYRVVHIYREECSLRQPHCGSRHELRIEKKVSP